MPILKGAKKALRQTRKRTKVNKIKKNSLQEAIQRLKKEKKESLLREVYKQTDKAVKSGVIRKNKAARIKSAASKLIPVKTIKKSTPKAKSK